MNNQEAKTGERQKVSEGRFKEITSFSNPLIKEIRALHLKKNRQTSGQFIGEGHKLIFDAIENGDWQVETIIAAKSQMDNQNSMALFAQARTLGSDIIIVPEKILGNITRRDNPQMIIGVFKQQLITTDQLSGLLEKPGDIVIALDRVRDPGNLGTILRSSDAIGAKAVILVGDTTDPFSTEAVRASMGSLFNVPLALMSEDQFISWKDTIDAALIGTHLTGTTDFRELDYDQKPAILLMGNEQQGLNEKLSQACSVLAYMPMAGQADSFNLAIATSIMLYEMRRHYLKMPDLKVSDPKNS